MASAIYTFQRGETISLALDAITGSTGDVSAITARLRKLQPGKLELQPTEPVAATFAVATRAASGDIPAGWTLTIADTASDYLSAGSYYADARLTVAGGVITTEPATIVIKEPATL